MTEPQIMQEFNNKFSFLRAHPDKNIIDDLTECCKKNIKTAYPITTAIINRLMDPATDPSFKLPMLYLTDAIMKRVGGTYPEYFSKHLAAVVQKAVNEFTPAERGKLANLIKTWEERRILPAEVLAQMSTAVSRRIAAGDSFNPLPPPVVHASYPPHPYAHTLPPQPIYHQPMLPYGHPVAQPHYAQPPPPPSLAGQKRPSRFDAAPGTRPPTTLQVPPLPSMNQVFLDMVQAEMSTLLSQLLKELSHPGSKVTFTIPELQQFNPPLYAQLHQSAEAQARVKFDTMMKSGGGTAIPLKSLGVGVETASSAHLLHGVMGTHTISLDTFRTEALIADMSMYSTSHTNGTSEADLAVSSRVAVSARIANMLKTQLAAAARSHPPPLPTILFGPLPLEATPSFVALQAELLGAMSKQKAKQAAVKFRSEELGRNPRAPLAALFEQRNFRFEDGIRFRTQRELNTYIDSLAAAKKDAKKLESGIILRREWYLPHGMWVDMVADHRLEDDVFDGKDAKFGSNSKSNKSGAASSSSNSREFLLPADEHFTRCPISKEEFEALWNENEGEFLYKHAVRVLVTALADMAVFKLGQATSQSTVKYIVAHKVLVVDEWVTAGKAATLKEAIRRYEAMGRNAEEISVLKSAAGEDEDEEDVFVMIEHRS